MQKLIIEIPYGEATYAEIKSIVGRTILTYAVKKEGGQAKAAKVLGVNRSTLNKALNGEVYKCNGRKTKLYNRGTPARIYLPVKKPNKAFFTSKDILIYSLIKKGNNTNKMLETCLKQHRGSFRRNIEKLKKYGCVRIL